MRLTPSHIWSVTLLVSTILLFVQSISPYFALALIVTHFCILILGILHLRLQFFGISLCFVKTSAPFIYLTFDDGPDPLVTPAVLDLLAEYRFKATFFCIGNKATQHPEILKRCRNEGHTIGVHDLTHSFLSNIRRPKSMEQEISEATLLLAEITGTTPTLYRPPIGLSNPYLHKVLKNLGLVCVGFNRWPGDAGNKRPERIGRILKQIKSGDIIVLHDTAPTQAKTAEFLIQLRKLFEGIVAQHLHCEKL